MGKKQTRSNQSLDPNERALRELQALNHRDLRRACIVRGIAFQELVELSIPALSNWFIANFEIGQNPSNLNEYDAWMEEQLKARGYQKGDPILSPSLRLGYLGENNPETNKPIVRRIKGIAKPNQKRERDSSGNFSGTKKSLTFELCKQGKTLDEVIEVVTEKFPEAVAKSIRIWYNKAKKTK